MMNLSELKRLYDMGFGLMWLHPKSKKPIDFEWTKGPRLHFDIIKKTFKENNNVGVRLGSASTFQDNTYLCVLDCDVKSSDPIHLKEMELALHSFCASHEFAPRVLSGRGGGSCHFYFRTKKPQQSFKAIRSGHKVKVYMPSVDASKADLEILTADEVERGFRMRLAWEVDVFGEGKQVVLPPSIHPDTMKEYEWEHPLIAFDSIPLIENFTPSRVRLTAVNQKPVSFKPVALFETPLQNKFHDLIVSGKDFDKYPSRSEALFASLNGLIMAGLSDEQIYTVLTDSANFMSEKPLEAGHGNRETAARWLRSQIEKIRAEGVERAKEVFIVDDLDEMLYLTDAEAGEQTEEITHWSDTLQRTEKGAVKNTSHNIYSILKNDFDGQPLFAYDQFKQSCIYMKAPHWGTDADIGRELQDRDDTNIRLFLSKEWKVETSENTIASIVTTLAFENAFHPVRRYLQGLKWDGKSRLDTWLVDYMGATDDSKYLTQVGRKTLVGAVARVMKPAIKWDYMLILEGAQGLGKSRTVKALASEDWFVDNLGDIENKDVVQSMRGRWIIEIGELATMDRASSNALKNFISREFDVNRQAYGRRSQQYDRQCIFIGTTNENEYLKDATGARRFWPVNCTKSEVQKITEDRDQLWAEAYYLFANGEALYIDDKEVIDISKQVQGSKFVVDQIQDKIKAALKGKGGVPIKDPEKFTFDELWSALDFGAGNIGRIPDLFIQKRIKHALTFLGYTQRRLRGPESERYQYFISANLTKMYNTGVLKDDDEADDYLG